MSSNTNHRLSRLMRISWEIQNRKHKTRSQALTAAWAIFLNEQIAIEYLTQKLNHHKPLPRKVAGQFSLFTH